MPTPDQIFLGIDPGYADMGFGVIRRVAGRDQCLTYGSIKTSFGESAGRRLKQVHDGLESIVREFKPNVCGVERLYFAKNVKTGIAVAEARGVIILCLEQLGIPYREFDPVQVKMAVCGHGRAMKPEMQRMTAILLGLKEIPKPDDAADALALAIATANTVQLAKLGIR